jgi:hypothetical protein
MFYDNKSVAGSAEACKLFADYFSSAFDNDKCTLNIDYDLSNELNVNSSLSSISFSVVKVESALKKLNWRKGAGSDGIPAIFVLKCAEVLALPLSMIYNSSLSTGHCPFIWKEAMVIPLFKEGSRSKVNNYRPISILCIFGKVLESLLYPIIYWHVKQHLLPQQHGFVSSRSTATNLASYVTDLVTAVDGRASADVIYTDFSKAFDKVDHRTLISKLYTQFGLHGNLLRWCASYLTNRKLKVVMDGYSSGSFKISSGVPQGSHLGPLFFNLFINDVAQCFRHSTFYLYADDLKIVRHARDITDCLLLQEDLNRFVAWCDINQMYLNKQKCNFIRFTKKHNSFSYTYKIADHNMQEVSEIRDLGIYFDKKLKFHIHIDKTVSKCFKTLGFIIRNIKNFKLPNSKIIIYNALIRASLEYCSVIWTPRYEVHIKRIESVQKRFMWYLVLQHNLVNQLPSYNERLSHFNIVSLQKRRQLLDQLFLYKVVNSVFDCDHLLQQVNFSIPRKLARFSRYKLFTPKSFKSNLGHFSTLDRMQNQFGTFSKNSILDINCRFTEFKRMLLNILDQNKRRS